MVQSARLPADTVSRGEVAAVRTAKETRARPFASGLERKAPRPWPRRKAPNTKVPAGVCGAPAGCRSGEPPADGCGNWHGHRTGHAERAVGAAIGARTRRCKLLHPTLYFFFFEKKKKHMYSTPLTRPSMELRDRPSRPSQLCRHVSSMINQDYIFFLKKYSSK